MFRLPANLAVGGQLSIPSLEQVSALEASLPPGSRILVALAFERRYERFEEDCERANRELGRIEGLQAWPECPGRFVTPDPDGQPIAWVHYLSSPIWWPAILSVLAGIFLLPVMLILPFWILERLFPGVTQLLMMVLMLMVIGGMMLMLKPGR